MNTKPKKKPQPKLKPEPLAIELKEIMLAQGMSQNQLAQKSLLAQAIISRFFRGERTTHIQSVVRIAKALGHELVLKETGEGK
jgi:transcriptional regulator with XRE-family HTH domain